jgi:hypothetical protein
VDQQSDYPQIWKAKEGNKKKEGNRRRRRRRTSYFMQNGTARLSTPINYYFKKFFHTNNFQKRFFNLICQ